MKHKKIISFLVVFVFLFSVCAVNASAITIDREFISNTGLTIYDEESFIDKINSIIDTIKEIVAILKGDSDAIVKIVKEMIVTILNALRVEINSGFNLIAINIVSGSEIDLIRSSLPVAVQMRNIVSITSVTAGTLSSLFWGIGILKQALRTEELTSRHWLSLAMGVIINMALVSNSMQLCYGIINIEAGLTGRILSGSQWGEVISEISADQLTLTIEENPINIAIFGVFFDFIVAIGQILPIIIALLAMLVIAMLVYIKLIIRQLELVCMVCVSPLFIACVISEPTRPFFRNFLASFCSVVFETLFMAITLAVGISFVNQQVADISKVWDFTKMCVSAIAVAVMCLKPPKALTNMIK